MNIFLLFLTSLFMIGYYVIYSPSQKIDNSDTEDVVKMSDLRSIAECVINVQNAMMNDTTYDKPCVARYNVVGQYVCANNGANNEIIHVSCNGTPDFNFIVTKSKPLDRDDYGPMLEVIEKFYSDKGTFGIYDETNHGLLTADATGFRPISVAIYDDNSANLSEGQLVYVMQYKIPYIYEYPDPTCTPVSGSCENCENCPEGTTPDFHYGFCTCGLSPNQPVMPCPAGSHGVLGQCILNDDATEDCTEPDGGCGEDATWRADICACVSDTLNCSDDCDITQDFFNTSDVLCICPDDDGVPTEACRTIHSASKLAPVTAQTGKKDICGQMSNHCLSTVEKLDRTTNTYNTVCVPNAKMSGTRTCGPSEDPVCNDGNKSKAIYFGFNDDSYTSCIPKQGTVKTDWLDFKFEEIKDYIPEDKRDGKFHCMTCEHGIDTEHSNPPYVVVCKQ